MRKLGIVGVQLLFKLIKQPLLVFRECHDRLLDVGTNVPQPTNQRPGR
jgi:hypothetical protein